MCPLEANELDARIAEFHRWSAQLLVFMRVEMEGLREIA